MLAQIEIQPAQHLLAGRAVRQVPEVGQVCQARLEAQLVLVLAELVDAERVS